MQKNPKQNKTAAKTGSSAVLKKAQRTIYWQAGLALLTVVLTVIIVFAMTAAWYTNVVQTSGLVIEAESWGFDGEIKVNSSAITAAPGDEGEIHLEVDNSGGSTSAVSVGVSKARMEQQMQQRLYFYVDTQLTRNGETMDRVYINTQDSYTYTLFGGQKLTLTEQLHSDAELKWQWVYDVLGYYVLGNWSEERDAMAVVEYLRPIEYNYDEATTTFTQQGSSLTMELKTVDGYTTVEEFLINISKNDGYEGEIDPDTKLGAGYYPVAVDEDGYGVYAYLCTYSDIEMATQYDTALALAALDAEKNGTDGQRYEAQLLISAQKNDENIIGVSTLSALESAIETYPGAVIQLTEDLTVSQGNMLKIPTGTQITLDLNGHTISGESSEAIISAEPGSSLTMLNGSIVGQGGKYGIAAVGAEVVCHQINLSNFTYGIYVSDHEDGNVLDSKIRLVDCNMRAGTSTVFLNGNGLVSEQKTQLIVEKSTLYGDYYVICANGTTTGNGRWGTDIQVLHSTLTSNPDKVCAAIYHPQKDSTLTVYNSTVSGYTGMAIKGGTVNILGSTVTGSGAKQAPNPSMSGFSDTGDAVYIESNYGYDILLTINGIELAGAEGTEYRDTVLNSLHGYSLQVDDPTVENVEIKIYSGKFNNEQRQEYLASGSIQSMSNGQYIVTAPQDTQ